MWDKEPKYESWEKRAVEPTKERILEYLKPLFLAFVFLFILGELIYYFFISNRDWYEGRTNELALGAAAKATKVSVPIYKTELSSDANLSEIWRLRKEHADRHQDLLTRPYHFPKVIPFLTGLEDGAPWVSVPDVYYHGLSNGLHPGRPAELLGLENPYLLVFPDFVTLAFNGDVRWNTAKIFQSDPRLLESADFPFRPEPDFIEWRPGDARGEVRYNVSNFLAKINAWLLVPLTAQSMGFDAVAYNAFEFGYPIVTLSMEDSKNVSMEQAEITDILFPFVHPPEACGVVSQCNQRGPVPPQLQGIRVAKLPARAVFHLWKRVPPSMNTEPDARFVIVME